MSCRSPMCGITTLEEIGASSLLEIVSRSKKEEKENALNKAQVYKYFHFKCWIIGVILLNSLAIIMHNSCYATIILYAIPTTEIHVHVLANLEEEHMIILHTKLYTFILPMCQTIYYCDSLIRSILQVTTF